MDERISLLTSIPGCSESGVGERLSLLTSIFSCSESKVDEHLSRKDAQTLIDVIDSVSLCALPPPKQVSWLALKLTHLVGQVLDSLPSDSRRRCLRTVYGISGLKSLLPKSMAIPICYDLTKPAQDHGGFADVWKGKYQGREVAAKVLRVYRKENPGKTRRVGRWWHSWPTICINN